MALQSLSGWAFYPPFSGRNSSPSGVLTQAVAAADYCAVNCVYIPKTGTVKKIGFKVTAVTAGDAIYRATLETVADVIGQPVSTTYSGRTLLVTGAESGDIAVPASAGVQWVTINGTSGVSVTAGTKAAIVVRCVSRSTGSVTIVWSVYGIIGETTTVYPYQATYTGSWTVGATGGAFALEYDGGEIVPILGSMPAPALTGNNWDSGDNPTFRGLKFTLPFKAKVGGICIGGMDADYNYKIHAYQSDEYTEFTGFPITVNSASRRADAALNEWVMFPTPFTAEISTAYRIAIEPIETGANNVNWRYWELDTVESGVMAGVDGGANFHYTAINDEPTSGSHTWTDTLTNRPCMGLLIKQLSDDVGSGGGGGPVMGGMVVR